MPSRSLMFIHPRSFKNPLNLAILLLITGAMALGQTESIVYHFKGGSDGSQPLATLTADAAGNLYGTTVQGGASTTCDALHEHFGCGTVFRLTRPTTAGSPWTESVIYTFTRGSDGAQPTSGVVFDQAGNLYGTTASGGSLGGGTLFQLSPPSQGGAWTETTLYNFAGLGNGAGEIPSYLAFDKSGNLYGYDAGIGFGGVFQLTPPATAGGAWSFKDIYSFQSSLGVASNGEFPSGGPILDAAGNLYGTTINGGNQVCNGGCGVVFKLKHPATTSGVWTESVLYSFQGLPDGSNPEGGLKLDKNGNFYGTTAEGGQSGASFGGYGTIFELVRPTEPGGTWTERVLYNFQNSTDGARPVAAVTLDKSGNLFGTAAAVAFELSSPTAPGGEWAETTLHNFAGTVGLGEVWGGLTFSKAHVLLYGTTQGGGICGKYYCNGMVFAVHP